MKGRNLTKQLLSLGCVILLLLSYQSTADEWSIGILTGSSPFSLSDPPQIQNPVLTAADVTDVSATFVADPFFIYENNQYHMYFEVLNGSSGHGDIGYAVSTNGLNWDYQQIVLDESFHLSYPQVFRANGQIYMVPESNENATVRLYIATNFPTEWAFVGNLLEGVEFVDNTLFQRDNSWWMFSSNTGNATLYLHYADNLEGPWTAHPQSPVITNDANIARPGGRVLEVDNQLVRIAQDDVPVYGESVRAFNITELTRTDYTEEEIPESPIVVTQGNDWRELGVHQLDALEIAQGEWIGVIDGYGNPPIIAPPDDLIDKAGWTLWFVDSEETAGEDGAATNAFDNDVTTFWHTNWSSVSPSHPHEIQINLGSVYEISALRYTPRQDGGVNGRVGQYQIFISTDGTNWGSSVDQGTFLFSANPQDANFEPTAGQYVKFVGLSEANNNPWTSVAELDLVGQPFSGNYPPTGQITQPSENISVIAGGSVFFDSIGNDFDGNTPLQFNWTFGAGSGVAESSVQTPGEVTFNNVGTYTVNLIVTDALGTPASSPAQVVINVSDGSEPQLLDQSLWQLLFVNSQEIAAEDGAASNAFDGDLNTFWHTQWSSSSPSPPHDLQIDLGAIFDLSQVIYTPRQDGATNGRISEFEVYVSSDGNNWGSAVAAGRLANSALPQNIEFNPVSGQFIWLRALSEVAGNNWTAVAELEVVGLPFSGNYAPTATINSPIEDRLISVGESVYFSGSGNDRDGDYPLNYSWYFGLGSGVANSIQATPGNITFNQAGSFIVSLNVSDSLGNQSNSPAQVTITVTDGNEPQRLAKTNWRLLSVSSEELRGENGSAVNAFDDDLNTIWHSQWLDASPSHPHDISIDLGANYEISSLVYTPRQDGGSNGRIVNYEIYVSVNGIDWASTVASGAFQNSANPQTVSFAPVSGRYIRLRALSETNNNPWTALAEIDVYAR
ncbi:discoidin domain-containing protein [Aliikangiella sp. IMCC44632]